MADFLTTPLGRQLPMGCWDEYRRDQILRLLYDFYRNPFNDGTFTLTTATIGRTTMLPEGNVLKVVAELMDVGLIEQPEGDHYRISASGIGFVHSIPRPPWHDLA